jgi:hypothetical protein
VFFFPSNCDKNSARLSLRFSLRTCDKKLKGYCARLRLSPSLAATADVF